MTFIAVVMGSKVTRVKSPEYGMMVVGLGNSTHPLFKASTRSLKT